jgi:Glycosyltransferase Family 4
MYHRILVLSESFEQGGLETHIESQIRILAAKGFTFFLATGSLPNDRMSQVGFADALTGLPMGGQATSDDILETVRLLTAFARRHDITLVHAHPFHSALIGMLTAHVCRLPFVVTLHGWASIAYDQGQFYNRALQRFVLPSCTRIFCVSQATLVLSRSLGLAGQVLLPNPVAAPPETRPAPAGAPWAWVGRVEGAKSFGLKDFIAKAPDGGISELHIYGQGGELADVEAFARQASNARLDVRFMGWRDKVATALESYAGVGGMGRVVVEAIAAERPAILVGSFGVKGVVDLHMAKRASFWNFSGNGFQTIDAQMLRAQITAFHADARMDPLRTWILETHDEAKVWSRYAESVDNLPAVENDRPQYILDCLTSRADTPTPVWEDTRLFRLIGGITAPPAASAGALAELSDQISALSAEVRELRENSLTARFLRKLARLKRPALTKN